MLGSIYSFVMALKILRLLPAVSKACAAVRVVASARRKLLNHVTLTLPPVALLLVFEEDEYVVLDLVA